jgi:hypothetical protein
LDDLRVFGRRDDEWTDGVNDECLSKKNDWRAGHRQDDPETNVTGRAGVCRPKPGRPASFPNYFISKKAAEHGAGVVILLEGKVHRRSRSSKCLRKKRRVDASAIAAFETLIRREKRDRKPNHPTIGNLECVDMLGTWLPMKHVSAVPCMRTPRSEFYILTLLPSLSRCLPSCCAWPPSRLAN